MNCFPYEGLITEIESQYLCAITLNPGSKIKYFYLSNMELTKYITAYLFLILSMNLFNMRTVKLMSSDEPDL